MSEPIEVGNIKPRIRYEGNGEETTFHFAFSIFSIDDIDVYLDDLLITRGYQIVLSEKGGSVIFDVAPQANIIITIYRNLDLKRTTNFQEVGPFRTSKVNLEFDYQLACLEQLQDTISRTVTFPPYASTQLNVSLPMPQSGKSIIWNEEGNSLINSTLEIDKFYSHYQQVLDNAIEVEQKLQIVTEKNIETIDNANKAFEYSQEVRNRPETIYTKQKDIGIVSGDITIQIEPGIFEYKVTPSANTNFSFDFGLCNTDMIISFSLLLKQGETAYTYSYSFIETQSFSWLDNLPAAPYQDFLLTFRRYPDGKVVGVANGAIS